LGRMASRCAFMAYLRPEPPGRRMAGGAAGGAGAGGLLMGRRVTWASNTGYAATLDAAAQIEAAAKKAGKSELEGIMDLVDKLEQHLMDLWLGLGQK